MDNGDYVVLLHGLGRTTRTMKKLARALKSAGYQVYNIGYQSTIYSIEQLVDQVYVLVKTHCADSYRSLHFVGHSLGAIIIRSLIARYRPESLGRVVMLGPPNRGSRVIDFFKRFRLLRQWIGPAAQELGTDSQGIVNCLPQLDYEAGVIAGDRRIHFLFFPFLSYKNDGTLSVCETELPGLQDFLVTHATHTFMSSNRIVISQILHFLKNGRFFRENSV